MNKLFTKILLSLVFLVAGQLSAQTVTRVDVLNQLATELELEWQIRQQKVQEYARTNNIPIRQENEDGTLMEIIDIKDGKPVFYKTDNVGAAQTTRAYELWEGGNSGLNITGEGYNQLGEWDGGAVRRSHQEFTDQGASRVTQMDGNSSTHYHATHVAGTLVAAGVNASAKGMAYGGNLKAWQWSNDESEMAAAAAQGLEISNHSYGAGAGWENYNGNWVWLGNSSLSATEDYKFGFYDGNSRTMDQIAYNAPNYLIVRSAGNERGEGPGDAGQNGKPEIDGGTDGYDCIQPEKLAKNVMTVGAAYEVSEYTGPEDVAISGFSSFGPADDGRVKPDIVGKGVNTFSTMDGSDTDYSSLNGTSMSAPNVAGSMALLQSFYQSLSGGVPMRSATLRGLVLHTADEAGPETGPDYIFGWGLMNAEKAANVITIDTVQNVIDELVLDGGDIYIREINVSEGSELRVTICWTDPAATPLSPALNPRTPMLVNDLDIRILDAENNTYYPYSLDPDNPTEVATTNGKNYVDNIEMIFISNPEAGTYTIYVDHDGSLENDEQAFSIIISGIDEYTVVPECSAGMDNPEDGDEEILTNQWFSWMPANYASSYDVYFGTDGDGTETPTNIFDGENFLTNGFSTLMEPSTVYYLEVVPRNNLGEAVSCNEIYTFGTLDAIAEFPYLQQMLEIDPPHPPPYWQTADYSIATWESTNMIGHGDNKAMICWNKEAIVETDYNNWFVSPPFEVAEGNEYYVSSFYKSFSTSRTETLYIFWGETPNAEDLTNLLYEDVDFSDANWRESGSLFVPDSDGLVYFGWQLASTDGFGIFLDEIEIENWGTVGLGDDQFSEAVSIIGQTGKVIVHTDEFWNNAELKIVNTMGQTVFSGKHFNNSVIDLRESGTGIYIVTIQKENKFEVKKLMLY